MKDKQFLAWLHQRLVEHHGEDTHVDYMWRLRAIVASTPASQDTPNNAWFEPSYVEGVADGKIT